MDINACKPKNATIAKLIALEAMITSLLSLIKTEDQSLAIKLIDTIEQRILKITTTKKRPRDDDDNNDNNDVLY